LPNGPPGHHRLTRKTGGVVYIGIGTLVVIILIVILLLILL
jgi:hypothetical protein